MVVSWVLSVFGLGRIGFRLRVTVRAPFRVQGLGSKYLNRM